MKSCRTRPSKAAGPAPGRAKKKNSLDARTHRLVNREEMPYHKKGTGLPSCYPPPQPVSQLRGTVWLFMARFGQESGAILLIHAFQVQPKTCCGYAMDSSSRHLIIMMHIQTHKQYTHSVSPSTEDENIHLFVRW